MKKQIYDFAGAAPPVLTEHRLKAAAAKKRRDRETLILTAAGLLFQLAALLLGFAALDWYPLLALSCFGYVLVSATGGGVIAIIYSRKGGDLSWRSLQL